MDAAIQTWQITQIMLRLLATLRMAPEFAFKITAKEKRIASIKASAANEQ